VEEFDGPFEGTVAAMSRESAGEIVVVTVVVALIDATVAGRFLAPSVLGLSLPDQDSSSESYLRFFFFCPRLGFEVSDPAPLSVEVLTAVVVAMLAVGLAAVVLPVEVEAVVLATVVLAVVLVVVMGVVLVVVLVVVAGMVLVVVVVGVRFRGSDSRAILPGEGLACRGLLMPHTEQFRLWKLLCREHTGHSHRLFNSGPDSFLDRPLSWVGAEVSPRSYCPKASISGSSIDGALTTGSCRFLSMVVLEEECALS
jgi:hypothetical protein